uniref:DM2 domain-containing protein n=1 Tax=Romanomermis culicivorax TaxID=13658 RepID=A0A915JRI5_ROMCU
MRRKWHRTPTTNETDGFQVKRPGDRHVRCTILLLLDHTPMKFKLDPRLARLLGIHTETRPKIIESLWEYIKEHKLQDAHERDHINCDKYLEQVRKNLHMNDIFPLTKKTFQCQRMRFMEIPQRLNALLLPPDPIVINHIITCNPDGTEPKRTACYDIDVEIDDPLKNKINQFLTSIQNLNDIATCDNKINEIVEQIQQVKLQREFYLSFAQDPITFIEKWIISQSRDLQVMTDANGWNEEERKSEFYNNAWISEAIGRYFYNKVAQLFNFLEAGIMTVVQQKRAELEQALGIKNV